MHAVIETSAYLRAAKNAGMTVREMEHAVSVVASDPTVGNLIVGTGGCRKLRLAKERSGKSGGYRVITFFGGDDIPVFLVTVFGKSEKSNLSKAERNALGKLAETLAIAYRAKVVRLG